MKLKFSVRGTEAELDVVVTADGTATVGDIADEIARCLPDTGIASTAQATVQVHGLAMGTSGASSAMLDPAIPVGESAMRSGTRISLSAAPPAPSRQDGRGDTVAKLCVLSGPATGREFGLPSGSSIIGRDAGSDIVLPDGFVSKKHVRVSVTDVVEVIDLGSANGTSIGGDQVQRAVIREDDRVSIGDTVFVIRPLVRLSGSRSPVIEFNRPPVVLPVFEDGEIAAPDVPSPLHPLRFPILALIVPLVLVVVMFFVLPKNARIYSLLFLGLSPLMILGGYVDQRMQARAERREEEERFREALELLQEELTQRRLIEHASRLREAPSTSDGLAAIEGTTPLLWSRRPDRRFFLDLRLGLGTAPSRTVLRLGDRGRARAEHWAALMGVHERFRTIDDVPIVASLDQAGGVGVAGPSDAMNTVARSLVLQLAALHSPADLAIAAIGSSLSVSEWDWLKWLPHVASPHDPTDGVSLASNAGTAERLASAVEELIARRTDRDSRPDGVRLPRLVLVVLDDAPIERSRLVAIAEAGLEAGVHVLWCATEYARIPAACRSYIELDSAGGATSGQVHLDELVSPISCEAVTLQAAAQVARRLAPIVDSGARVDDDTDLPGSVSFLTSFGTDLANDPGEIVERWTASDPTLAGQPLRRDGISLRAVVGHGAGDAFALDLHVHGPHALVGGTTGSGKSEFLQSWVLALAASHSPRRVTFLFVDYKGGAAFKRCTELPHCVGLVTDLDQHLVRRALESLRAELRHREHILRRHDAKDIADLDRNPEAETLPRLLIVVDEFAALVQEIPEFVDGVIDIAQRGRSLGIHLILATQRPSGVITGSLRANTNLRVALRVADADDSSDVLGDARAAAFDPAIPGRAAAKTGPGRITVFQSLYAGGSTPDVAPRPEVVIETLSFDAPQRIQPVTGDGVAAPVEEEPESDLSRVVDQIRVANRRLELPEPRKPWLPELAPVYDYELIDQRSDAELVIGIQDVPQQQTNQVVHFRPDDDGNMVIFGTGGAGKSTALRTLAIAAARTRRGGPCDVYGLDFGAGGLSLIEGLAHVGAIIQGTDHERLGRLLRWLHDEIDDRSRRYAEAKASSITEYRRLAERPDERRILVLLDGFGAFRQEYDTGPYTAYYKLFGQLASDGRGVGIHAVVTADRPGAIPTSLAATVQRRLVLRLASTDDYSLVDVPGDVLHAKSPPGRGVLDGLEVQVAVFGGSESLPRQAAVIGKFASYLVKRGRANARPIERLSDRLALSDLPLPQDGRICIGVDDEHLEPFGLDVGGSFLVVGPPASGRTTALAMLAEAVRRTHPRARGFLFTHPRTTLRDAMPWAGTATVATEIEALAGELATALESGAVRSSSDAPVLVVFEAVDHLAGELYGPALERLAKVALAHGAFVVGESEVSALGQAYPLGPVLTQARRGIALQPDESDGYAAFRTVFPRINRSEFPPGRGIIVDRGKLHRIQVALPE